MSGGPILNIPKYDLAEPCPASRPVCFAVILCSREIRAIDRRQWDALSDAAIEPNPFFSRSVVNAGIKGLKEGPGLYAIAFRLHSDGKLVGLFPFRRERFGRFLPLTDARAPNNIYQPGSTPLIDRAHAHCVMESWLDLVHSDQNLPSRWAFPHTDIEGPFAKLLAQHASERGLAVRSVETYKRPILTRHPDGFHAHIETVIGNKRAKDIQRNIRRLKELGTLRFERMSDRKMIPPRLEQFLAMEHAGWKGKKETSFLSHPDHARFARLAYSGNAASIDTLLLDETPIAISVNLRAGSTLFTPKCAFNETFRKYGPGLILEYLVIEAFYAGNSFTSMNAATTIDGHVIAGFWNDERPMGTIIVGPQGVRTSLLAWMEDTEHGTRKWAKKLINRLRRPAP